MGAPSKMTVSACGKDSAGPDIRKKQEGFSCTYDLFLSDNMTPNPKSDPDFDYRFSVFKGFQPTTNNRPFVRGILFLLPGKQLITYNA